MIKISVFAPDMILTLGNLPPFIIVFLSSAGNKPAIRLMQSSYLCASYTWWRRQGRCCVLAAACLALVKYFALWLVRMFVEWLDLVSGSHHPLLYDFPGEQIERERT